MIELLAVLGVVGAVGVFLLRRKPKGRSSHESRTKAISRRGITRPTQNHIGTAERERLPFHEPGDERDV